MKIKYISAMSLVALFVLAMNVNSGNLNIINNVNDSNMAPLSAASASLPAGPAPTGDITIKKNGVSVATFTVEQIREYTENETIPVKNYTGTIGGTPGELRGVNPLKLLELAGLKNAKSFEVISTDSYTKVFNVSDCIMADKSYYKNVDPDTNATILVLSVGDTWLADFVPSNEKNYGNFMPYGDFPKGFQVANTSVINQVSEWDVKVTINGTTVLTLNEANFEIFNYTTYNWGYNTINTTWMPSDCTGTTIASIIKTLITNTETDYKVSFIAVDGYGASKSFNKTVIENGATGDSIANYTEYIPLEHAGRQAMIAHKLNGTALDYASGPYMLVIPGLQKGNYIKEIVEIQITAYGNITAPAEEPTDTTPSNGIAGYNPIIMLFGLGIGIIFIKKSRK